MSESLIDELLGRVTNKPKLEEEEGHFTQEKELKSFFIAKLWSFAKGI